MTPDCEIGVDCKGDVHGHHDDYARPEDLRWLCRRHHALWHVEHGHALNYHLAPHFGQKCVKFTCDADLTEWLMARASAEYRSLADVIRRILYEAKLREEETALA